MITEFVEMKEIEKRHSLFNPHEKEEYSAGLYERQTSETLFVDVETTKY